MSLEFNDEIKQLVPAPGWRVYGCAIYGDKPNYHELPVIGWVVRHRTHDNGNEWDDLELYVYTDYPCALEDAEATHNAIYRVVPPGDEITDEFKADLLQDAKAKIERQEADRRALWQRVIAARKAGHSDQQIAASEKIDVSYVERIVAPVYQRQPTRAMRLRLLNYHWYLSRELY